MIKEKKIEVSGLQINVEGYKIPKGYIKTENKWDRDVSVYWIWYLAPFIMIKNFPISLGRNKR